MDSNIIPIVIAVPAAGLIILVALVRWKKAKREKMRTTIAAVADAEGWQNLPVAGTRQIYRLQGKMAPDITWEIVAERPGKSSAGSSRSQSVVWRTQDVRLKEGVIGIGPGGGLGAVDVDLNHPLIQSALRRIFGGDLASELGAAQILELPEGMIPRSCLLLTDSPDLAGKFLRDPLPAILRDWGSEKMSAPILLFWKGGMQVRFTRGVEEGETLRKMVALCGVFALRGRETAKAQRDAEQKFDSGF